MNPKTSNSLKAYGISWPATMHPLAIELKCIERGGRWKLKNKEGEAGFGMYHHYRRAQELLWPDKRWHHWRELSLQLWLENQYTGEMGCAAGGKSDDSATDHLCDWYALPYCTTTLVCSTTLPAADVRVWGNIKRYHREAKQRFAWLPGHLLEGARKIIQDARDQFKEGRDFKNGLIVVPCKKGNSYVGIADWIGIHNKRVRVLADEANMVPRAFVDACSNLSKCEDFKLRALGNPNETTNAHGFICEPHADLGGWEANLDQKPGTKHWRTRMPRGVAIQKPGSDSPNFKVSELEPVPFPFLMTRQQMTEDAALWGVDDWHYTMFNEARMPRGQGSRRVLTRQLCEKFRALESPVWRDTHRTSIAFLDAAYRGVGGDRCVFGEIQFGEESEAEAINNNPALNGAMRVGSGSMFHRQILAVVDLMVIPISAESGAELPEHQIAKFAMQQCINRGIPAANFFYDAGMRTSLVTAMAQTWEVGNSVDCGGRPSESTVSSEISTLCRDYYSKFISELWYSVRFCVEARQFRGLTQDAMWEFCSREFKTVAGNKIEVESKEEMKKKTGRSPDLADAIAVGVWGARQRGFIISKLAPPKSVTRGSENWKRDLQRKAHDLWTSKDLSYA